MADPPGLARRLGATDAVLIGLGSMIGAGVFSVFAPAAGAAGAGLLVGLAIAAGVAYANAMASAQLAAQYPTSGGTYVFGRERLGPAWGFVAGWCFVVGKTASCAAMALTFAAYVAPQQWQRPVAVCAVALLATVSYRGVTRTARLTRVIVIVVLVGLAIIVAASVASAEPTWSQALPWSEGTASWYTIVQSAGLLFFAFAGYARIATMGEEVRNPRQVIPRAITIAVLIVVGVYTLIAVVLLAVLGAEGVAATSAPLEAAAEAGSWTWVTPVVRVAATAASLGALLALLTGVARTSLAMARHGDLPRWLAAVHPRHHVPHHAEVTLAVIVCVLVVSVDLRGAIGFSSFGVLVYYLITNLAARTQGPAHRRYPRALQAVGAAGCFVLVAALPPGAIIGGVVVLVVGAAGYRVRSRAN